MNLKELVKEIVSQAKELKDKHTDQKKAPVNYACVFCQNDEEYDELLKLAKELGKVVKETNSGQVFEIEPIDTVAGPLDILKIRKPDKTRPERGDADFTVDNYTDFKAEFLDKEGFKLIERIEMEMIELMDSEFNVRVYFSDPTLREILRIK